MKKLVAIGACIILLLSFSFAFAAEKNLYEADILFRNIPWMSSYEDTIVALSDTKLAFRDINYSDSFGKLQNIIEGRFDSSTKYDTYAYCNLAYNSPQLNVAGHETINVQLCFAYLSNKDGIITKSPKDTALILAKYVFEPADLVASTIDMKEKLISLYGDIDYTSSYNRHYYYWLGQNNTFVCLEGEEYPDTGSIYMRVWYGTFDGDDLLQTANKLQEQATKEAEEAQFKNSGTDGL